MPEDEDKDKKKSDENEAPAASPAPPKNQEAPPPPPGYGPPGQYPPQQPFNPASLGGNKLLVMAIGLGIILMLIGSILIAMVPTIGDLDEDDPDKRLEDQESQQNTEAAGESLFNVGGFLLAMFLLFAATFRDDMNSYARLGMFVAAGLIITKFIVF